MLLTEIQTDRVTDSETDREYTDTRTHTGGYTRTRGKRLKFNPTHTLQRNDN
jgi:hypothetical protein